MQLRAVCKVRLLEDVIHRAHKGQLQSPTARRPAPVQRRPADISCFRSTASAALRSTMLEEFCTCLQAPCMHVNLTRAALNSTLQADLMLSTSRLKACHWGLEALFFKSVRQ